MNKRILFVDDEPMVLQGIQRSLRTMRNEWDIEFATSGPEALENMARAPFDVVITDMRMPGMDGAQLLELVKAKFPRTVRMVLSGQSDRETILRSVGPTHQYLSKPCDVEELRQKLQRAFALRDLLDDSHLKEIVCRLETVPSLPSLYVAVTKALQSPETSLAEVGSIVGRDMAMSMKVLQLVNSAFFGLPCNVSNPQQAVALIGIENLKALVLTLHVFSGFEGKLSQELSFLWNHSLATAGLAKSVARAQHSNRTLVDDAFAAGLLHDVGRLILASACSPDYEKVLRRGAEPGALITECEREVFGCTHAAVGAYMLGLWGLSDPVVEAVAWHHEPSGAAPTAFSSLIAVHVADHYEHQMRPSSSCNQQPPLDETLLTNLGIKEQIAAWASTCEGIDSKGGSHA